MTRCGAWRAHELPGHRPRSRPRIGSTTAICSVVKAVVLQNPPYPHVDRLVTAAITSPQWSLAMLEAVERVDSLFERMAGIHERGVTISGGAAPSVIRIEGVSTDYFELLGVFPVAGAIWSAEQDVESPAGAVALISTRLLRQRFGDAVDAIGKPFVIDGTAVTAVPPTVS